MSSWVLCNESRLICRPTVLSCNVCTFYTSLFHMESRGLLLMSHCCKMAFDACDHFQFLNNNVTNSLLYGHTVVTCSTNRRHIGRFVDHLIFHSVQDEITLSTFPDGCQIVHFNESEESLIARTGSMFSTFLCFQGVRVSIIMYLRWLRHFTSARISLEGTASSSKEGSKHAKS